MSKIGKKPMAIPAGVEVSVRGQVVKVKGPKGELTRKLEREIKPEVVNGEIVVKPVSNSRTARQLWGLNRTLISNMLAGVTAGFKKDLELVGIGYRAEKKGEGISLSLGFSHPVEFKPPEGVTLEVPERTKVVVSGIDKQLVGQTAARIRQLRPPEPYKGKGIRYAGEVVKKKAGKAAKVGAGFGAAGA